MMYRVVHSWKSGCPDIQVAITSWEARIRWALVMTVLEADMCSLDLRIGVTSSVDVKNTSWRRFELVVFVRKGRRREESDFVVEIDMPS